jgi:agmatinase
MDVPPARPETARYHVIPAPLERSVSYGHGTAAGPLALLKASLQLEAFDGTDVPAEAGIHTQAPVDCESGGVLDALNRIAEAAGRAVAAGAVPVVLGGEHTVTLGPVRALREAGVRFGVVQFDAHADLRAEYEGTPFSHACVMRRIVEMDVPVFQIGVRSLSQPEAEFRRENRVPHLDALVIGRKDILSALLPVGFPDNIYITFDVDAFDPAVMPGTGTPEPGGLFWYDAINLLRTVIHGKSVAGFDMVELSPIPGQQVSEFTAAKLTYAIMGMINRIALR